MFDFLKRKDTKSIHVNEINNLVGTVELIDVREPYEYKSGSIKGAKNIPMDDLIKQPDKFLNKNNTYYIMCQSGGRSSNTCSILSKYGYDVINVAGGYSSYVGTKKVKL